MNKNKKVVSKLSKRFENYKLNKTIQTIISFWMPIVVLFANGMIHYLAGGNITCCYVLTLIPSFVLSYFTVYLGYWIASSKFDQASEVKNNRIVAFVCLLFFGLYMAAQVLVELIKSDACACIFTFVFLILAVLLLWFSMRGFKGSIR